MSDPERERWSRLQELFDAALQHDADERSAFVAQACGGDPALQAELEELLAASDEADIAVTTMQTDVGQLIGTLQYMSPEQCEADPGNIDTRSDVYSLGIVLYELLCGKLPYEVTGLALHEATRVIREDPPARLSCLDARLRGDVETIVRKALQKDREARYGSAAELSDDLRRYLTGDAILARPPSTVYRLRVFARRHKALVGGVAAVFVALTLGIIGTSLGLVQAKRRRAEAEEARAEAVEVTAFLSDALSEADLRHGRGPDLKLSTILDEAATRLETGHRFAAQPAVKATLHEVIGNAYVSRSGYHPKAEKHLRAALAIRRRLFGPEHPQVAESLHDLGIAIRYKPGGEQIALQRQALPMRQKLFGDEHVDTLSSMHELATSLCNGVDPEAETLFRKALAGRRKTLGPEHPDVALTLFRLGVYLSWVCREREAEPILRQALAIRRERMGEEDLFVAHILGALGDLHASKGDLDGAERACRAALAIYRKKRNDEHQDLVFAVGRLGRLLLKKGEPEKALPFLREAAEKRAARGTKGADDRLAKGRVAWGECLTRLGRHADAERQLLAGHSLLEVCLAETGAPPDRQARRRKAIQKARQRLVELYTAWGKPDQAAQWRAKLSREAPGSGIQP